MRRPRSKRVTVPLSAGFVGSPSAKEVAYRTPGKRYQFTIWRVGLRGAVAIGTGANPTEALGAALVKLRARFPNWDAP